MIYHFEINLLEHSIYLKVWLNDWYSNQMFAKGEKKIQSTKEICNAIWNQYLVQQLQWGVNLKLAKVSYYIQFMLDCYLDFIVTVILA